MNKSSINKGRENVKKLIKWYRGSNENDIKEFMRRGAINKTAIAKELGFSKSTFGSNKRLKKVLSIIDASISSGSNKIGANYPNTMRSVSDSIENSKLINELNKRVLELEHVNASLKVQVLDLKSKLKNLKYLDDYLDENGRIPRR